MEWKDSEYTQIRNDEPQDGRISTPDGWLFCAAFCRRPASVCSSARRIRNDEVEQLELIPARLEVVQHDRVKYACRCCEQHMAIADKPPQPIEKGLPGPGLCAHTVLGKFGDHQPWQSWQSPEQS